MIDFEDFPLRRDSSLPAWSNATARQRQAWRRNGIVPNDYAEPVAADWSDLLAIVDQRIKGKRASHSTAPWWLFERRRGGLYTRIAGLEWVLVNSQISAHHCFATLAVGPVFAHRLNVFAHNKLSVFACLESSSHCIWSRFFGYTLEDRFGYSPSDCFETFPFPPGFETDPALQAAGQAYHDHRARLMVERNEGMTKTYNRFHDPDQQDEGTRRLRELYAAVDHAVLAAYGWHDLAARAEPIFLDETNEDDHTYQDRLFWPSDFRDEVLSRLLALNAQRHVEEAAAGLVPGAQAAAAEEDENGNGGTEED